MKRIWTFLFPPSRWNRCNPMTETERLAQWEIRSGEHRAQERMRKARVAQLLDERSSITVRAKVTPKLPNDRKVVQIREKSAVIVKQRARLSLAR